MKVTWEVEDGYVGPSAPQNTEVPDEELAECQTNEEREELIRDYVEEDFQEKISWCILSKED